MSLTLGELLLHYTLIEQIGAGGMGVVYGATDTKLRRDVAIKVLPDDVAQDAERLARFDRQAHVLASLNHPGIASIHGLEESDALVSKASSGVARERTSALYSTVPSLDEKPTRKGAIAFASWHFGGAPGMRSLLALAFACVASLVIINGARSKPLGHQLEAVRDNVYGDLVGDVDGTAQRVSSARQDTIWSADWTFGTGATGRCDGTGWTAQDNRIR